MEHNKSKRIEVFHHPAVNGCWWWTMDDQRRWLWQQLLQSVVPRSSVALINTEVTMHVRYVAAET